jgi:hypothetical protein
MYFTRGTPLQQTKKCIIEEPNTIPASVRHEPSKYTKITPFILELGSGIHSHSQTTSKKGIENILKVAFNN